MGTLGSLVFLGIVIGSVLAAVIMDKINIKLILFCAFAGNLIGTLLFLYFAKFAAVSMSRLLSGFC